MHYNHYKSQTVHHEAWILIENSYDVANEVQNVTYLLNMTWTCKFLAWNFKVTTSPCYPSPSDTASGQYMGGTGTVVLLVSFMDALGIFERKGRDPGTKTLV